MRYFLKISTILFKCQIKVFLILHEASEESFDDMHFCDETLTKCYGKRFLYFCTLQKSLANV